MYDIIIIGSGLSASSFLNKLKIKGRKIGIISPSNLKIDKKLDQGIVDNIENNIPPRFNKKNDISYVKNYFVKNRIIMDSQTSIFGSLNHGGVSNYWGGSCEFLTEKDIKFLNRKNRNKIIQLLLETYEQNNFTGEIKLLDKKIQIKKHSKINKTFKKIILDYSNKQFNFYENCSAQNWKTKKILKPNTLINNKVKEIENLNYFVHKIEKLNNYYIVFCEDNKKKIKFKTKKLILAAGTISTTKLVCKLLNINKSLKIFHNPMLFGFFLLREKITLDNFSSSKLACKIFSNNSSKYSSVNFRSSSEVIKKKIFNDFFIMKNFISQKLYKYFQNNFLFFNLYLDNNYSNLNFILDKSDYLHIKINKSKHKIISRELIKQSKALFEYFSEKKLIYPFKFNLIPKLGHDNHYIGTIPINGKDKNLSLSENCELKKYKNLFIVDGSAIPKNNLKFPTALIIANAMRIGEIV